MTASQMSKNNDDGISASTHQEQLNQSRTSPLIPSETSDPDVTVASIAQNGEEDTYDLRRGTIASARFNILSTMVGGGSLSLPLAFHQAGNSLLAPVLLIGIAYLVQNSIRYLLKAAILAHPDDDLKEKEKLKGRKSFDSVASAAFGEKGKYATMGLLATICFFTIVGYAVLLRDMLLPFSDLIFGKTDESGGTGPTFHHNITMLAVILIVTPLCTLRDLTPLEKVGALSMTSIFAVACCIAFRSVECNFSPAYDNVRLKPWYEYINLVPSMDQGLGVGFHDLLNSLPILLSVFMCHFNVLPVHNELSNPTPVRVHTLFASSIWGACAFYLFVGFSGSMYGNCTAQGMVEGNILLSFEEDDVLLIVGRLCLSLTITAAFPILVVPCRDVVLRAFGTENEQGGDDGDNAVSCSNVIEEGVDLDDNRLSEPLLANGHENNDNCSILDDKKEQDGILRRRIVSIVIFWTGAIVACCVDSIDVVWDVLGGSLSLIMGFIIPSASYIVMSQALENVCNDNEGLDEENRTDFQSPESSSSIERAKKSFKFAYFLLLLFIPMIVLLTGNAIYNLSS
jgi:amino acid permease